MSGENGETTAKPAQRAAYAAASHASARALPNTCLASSATLGWTSALLEHHRGVGRADPFETRETPDLTIVVAVRGVHTLEVWRKGRWVADEYRPSSLGLTAPGESSRLRWYAQARGAAFEILTCA